MIERNDINDSEVLSKSTMDKDDKGNIKFKYVLPSGKPLSSEWIRPDDRKRAMMLWVDVVKDNIIADIEDTRREQAQAHKKAVQTVDTVADVSHTKIPGTVQDPVEFAANQVALLEAEERHWQGELERAKKHFTTAGIQLRKWQNISAALSAGDSGNEQAAN